MKKMLSKYGQVIKFGLVGVINTLINWSVFFILNSIGVFYIVSNIIAYSVATINSYICNRKWVFKYDNGAIMKSSIKFLILNLFGLVLNTSILFLLVDIVGIHKMVSLIIATIIVMCINYLVNKMWVFAK